MELTLFGGLRLCNDTGDTRALSARKAKALLAWLALHQDARHPRDRLALLLWEESNDAQARHSLRQALSGLRKALGRHAEALLADQESIVLRSGHLAVDVLRFDGLLKGPRSEEALSQAVALYGGEFLEGFNPRSNTYEEWLMTQRSHYRERAMGAMSELLAHYLETQQLEEGVRLAIRLLGSDPLLEHVHRTLMQLYVRLNRPADALRQYRHCRRRLSQELGLAPEPETVRLYEAIARDRIRAQGDEVAADLASEPPQTAVPADQDHSPNESPPAQPPTPEQASEQQLRQLTVVHLHSGHYLELATADPEQAHRQSLGLRHRVEGLARDFDGLLHHQHNEALVVLFGLSTAHANEGEKALRMVEALRDQIGRGADALGIRAGIASGLALCDAMGGVSGALFAQAERLSRGGQPGEIRVSEATYRGLRLSVEADRCGDDAWRVRSIPMPSSVRAATLPLVGRQRELRQLDAALRACIEDKVGETFLLRGEAGIGKTRLVEELGRRAETLGAANHRALILDFGMESHAEPIPSLLRLLLGLDTDAGADDIEACVKACLGRLWREPLHRPALHALFRLPLVSDSHRPLAELSESARRAASRELLQGLVASQAQARPRLLVVEDIHWADPHTLALLAELADAVSRCAAVLVITSRVEGEPLDPGWRSAMHGAPLTTLDLGPLPETQAWQLAQGISEGDAELIQRCIERSGGNPFFLQQLLWGACDPEDKVPDSVQSLVLARLDMLGDADRLAARAASVLGQRFRPDSLRHLLQDEGYQPDALLEQRLIRPEVEGYLFVHALLRDAIYDSLLATQRRALHLRASDWYRERDPALYARHLDLAGDVQAAQAYLRAAQWALPAFDFEQALALATRGLEIAQASDLRAELGSLRGDLLIQAGAIGEANAAYGAAAAAARDDRTRCRALIGLAAGLTVQDALDQALELLDQAAPLAQASGDDALQTELHYRRGDVLFALGRVNECLDAHRQAQRHAKAAEAPLLEIRAQAGLADAYYARGRMRTAWNHFHRCVELARREQRLPQELGNLSMRGLARFYAGSVSAALSDAREAAELAAEYRNLRAELIAHMSLALVLLYTEDVEGAKCAGRRGLELARQLGASRFFADNLAAIGEALALQGEVEEGVKCLERAYRSALDSVPTHIASFVLSVLARVTPDDTRRQQAITEGKCWLDRGSLGHNHLHFYQNLIDVSLNRNDPEGAAQYAQALDRFTQAEPLPWSDFYIARGRLLAEVQQQGVAAGHLQQARQLLETARSMGLYVGTRELAVLVGR